MQESRKDYMKRYNKDLKGSWKVSQFTNKWVYSTSDFSNVEWKNDDNSQNKGVDLEFDYNNYHYVCDEKCSEYWMNTNLTTFNQEVSRICSDGVRRKGWFTSPSYLTNSYMYIYLDKVIDNQGNKCTINNFNSEDIKKATCILVKKSKVEDWIYSRFTEEEMYKYNRYIADNGDNMTPEELKKLSLNGVRWHYNYGNWEKTVNILVPREELIKMADLVRVIEV